MRGSSRWIQVIWTGHRAGTVARTLCQWYRFCRERHSLSVVAEQCLCIDTRNVMATAEQMQEAFQQLQAQGARIASLETQLQIESARAQTAEQERNTLIQRTRLRRVDTQSAQVHAYKVRRLDSHCSDLGSTTAKDRCQDRRSIAKRPLDTPDHCLWRTKRRSRTDRQH